ncbi:hypothetical protein KQI38_09225 [Tissierella carlieri]|uniref:hypothetical protein n=1 Tax=Tissierella carlieri TaxID=689904 RepID=UPI001C11A18E|nr:hypothetical protein [Tissierella carlieri]MBU5312207.1 hypothetical protein [Tissierella carlieri]
MAEERSVRIEDSGGNIYYPHSKAKTAFMEDGKTVEAKLKQFLPDVDSMEEVYVPYGQDIGTRLDSLKTQGTYLFKYHLGASTMETSIIEVRELMAAGKKMIHQTMYSIDAIQYRTYSEHINKWSETVVLSYGSIITKVIVTGSYTKTTEGKKTISLGFKPRYVKLIFQTASQESQIVEKIRDAAGWAMHKNDASKQHVYFEDRLIKVWIIDDGFEVESEIQTYPISYLAIR